MYQGAIVSSFQRPTLDVRPAPYAEARIHLHALAKRRTPAKPGYYGLRQIPSIWPRLFSSASKTQTPLTLIAATVTIDAKHYRSHSVSPRGTGMKAPIFACLCVCLASTPAHADQATLSFLMVTPNPSASGEDVTLFATVVSDGAAPLGEVSFHLGPRAIDASSLMTYPAMPSQISVDGSHACSVTQSGGVLCWGKNNWGQLGIGSIDEAPTPTPVVGLPAPVIQVAAGGNHTCALTIDGAVWCWGLNALGELGIGRRNFEPGFPQPVVDLQSGVRQISAGSGNTCAVTTQGAAYCWGYNAEGTVGDGSNVSVRWRPRPVSGLDTGVQQISVGDFHACALMESGDVFCWGANYSGQLGAGDDVDRNVPVRVQTTRRAVSISTGWDHTCMVDTYARVSCWGSGYAGALGYGGDHDHWVPRGVRGLRNVATIALGGSHSCALTRAGRVFCWGLNEEGEVGDNTLVDRTVRTPVALPPRIRVQAIAAGSVNTCVMMENRRIQCWGDNFYGQVGDGTYETPRPSPVRVNGGAIGWFGPRAIARFLVAGGWVRGHRRIFVEYPGTTGFAPSVSARVIHRVQ